MFVVNDGQFSTMMTVTAYYTVFAVLVTFNVITNNNEDYRSAKTWIGKLLVYLFESSQMNKTKYFYRDTVELLQFCSFLQPF